MNCHILSQIDLEHKSALCAICGFTTALNVSGEFGGSLDHSPYAK
jgi:hypothetical protein